MLCIEKLKRMFVPRGVFFQIKPVNTSISSERFSIFMKIWFLIINLYRPPICLYLFEDNLITFRQRRLFVEIFKDKNRMVSNGTIYVAILCQRYMKIILLEVFTSMAQCFNVVFLVTSQLLKTIFICEYFSKSRPQKFI